MTIPEDILSDLKCSIKSDFHYAYEPILLKCGSNACKNCIIDSPNEKIKCYGCGDDHDKKDYLDSKINKIAKTVAVSFLNDLIEDLNSKLSSLESFSNGNKIFKINFLELILY